MRLNIRSMYWYYTCVYTFYSREAVSKRQRLKVQGLHSSDPICGLIKTVPIKRKRGKCLLFLFPSYFLSINFHSCCVTDKGIKILI